MTLHPFEQRQEEDDDWESLAVGVFSGGWFLLEDFEGTKTLQFDMDTKQNGHIWKATPLKHPKTHHQFFRFINFLIRCEKSVNCQTEDANRVFLNAD